MPVSSKQIKIETINERFFGSKKTNRYLVDVYKECAEKLITTNTLLEVWGRTKGAHAHERGKNCNHCAVFFQIYYSCVDSLFLHLRLLLSKEEPFLADDFLKSVKDLSVKDFKSYYQTKYEHSVTKDEEEVIKPLFALVNTNLNKLTELYRKRIEPYQAYAFHSPENGKYYKVNTSVKKGEGIKFVTHKKQPKFKRDLSAAKEMLNLIGKVFHDYLKLTSSYYHVNKIYTENYIKEIISLLGVELNEKDLDDLVKSTAQHTKEIVHVLECSSGLSSHNGLQSIKIKRALGKKV